MRMAAWGACGAHVPYTLGSGTLAFAAAAALWRHMGLYRSLSRVPRAAKLRTANKRVRSPPSKRGAVVRCVRRGPLTLSIKAVPYSPRQIYRCHKRIRGLRFSRVVVPPNTNGLLPQQRPVHSPCMVAVVKSPTR